jgi:hypothetical protein
MYYLLHAGLLYDPEDGGKTFLWKTVHCSLPTGYFAYLHIPSCDNLKSYKQFGEH